MLETLIFREIRYNENNEQLLKENLEKIKNYIIENFYIEDVLVIQGNWGYTYNLVKWAIENDYLPVYSYTERNVEEIKDGETVKKISYFKHVKFIKYE